MLNCRVRRCSNAWWWSVNELLELVASLDDLFI
jgi:hypothetical protein